MGLEPRQISVADHELVNFRSELQSLSLPKCYYFKHPLQRGRGLPTNKVSSKEISQRNPHHPTRKFWASLSYQKKHRAIEWLNWSKVLTSWGSSTVYSSVVDANLFYCHRLEALTVAEQHASWLGNFVNVTSRCLLISISNDHLKVDFSIPQVP